MPRSLGHPSKFMSHPPPSACLLLSINQPLSDLQEAQCLFPRRACLGPSDSNPLPSSFTTHSVSWCSQFILYRTKSSAHLTPLLDCKVIEDIHHYIISLRYHQQSFSPRPPLCVTMPLVAILLLYHGWRLYTWLPSRYVYDCNCFLCGCLLCGSLRSFKYGFRRPSSACNSPKGKLNR